MFPYKNTQTQIQSTVNHIHTSGCTLQLTAAVFVNPSLLKHYHTANHTHTHTQSKPCDTRYSDYQCEPKDAVKAPQLLIDPGGATRLALLALMLTMFCAYNVACVFVFVLKSATDTPTHTPTSVSHVSPPGVIVSACVWSGDLPTGDACSQETANVH